MAVVATQDYRQLVSPVTEHSDSSAAVFVCHFRWGLMWHTMWPLIWVQCSAADLEGLTLEC